MSNIETEIKIETEPGFNFAHLDEQTKRSYLWFILLIIQITQIKNNPGLTLNLSPNLIA